MGRNLDPRYSLPDWSRGQAWRAQARACGARLRIWVLYIWVLYIWVLYNGNHLLTQPQPTSIYALGHTSDSRQPLKDNKKSPCGAVFSMTLTTPRIVMSRFLRLLSLAANHSVVANWAFLDSSERALAKLRAARAARAAQYYLQAKTARYRSYFFQAIAVMCRVSQMFAQIYCRI